MKNQDDWSKNKSKATKKDFWTQQNKIIILSILIFLATLKALWPTLSGENIAGKDNLLASDVGGIIEVPINKLASENASLTHSLIKELRSTALAAVPQLLGENNYSPSPGVFGQDDSLPWLSVNEQYLNKAPSSESPSIPAMAKVIINPYMLLWPDIILKSASNIQWRETALSPENIGKIIPQPDPLSLRYYPSDKKIELEYDLSAHLANINRATKSPADLKDVTIEVVAVNANDFGYMIQSLLTQESREIQSGVQNPHPDFTLSIIGPREGLCSGVKNCNHRLPSAQGMSINADKLPAVATFGLWRLPPEENQAPDLKFIIKFY